MRRLIVLAIAQGAAAQPRYAYATLISGSLDYLPGVETLLCSITRAQKKAEKMHNAWTVRRGRRGIQAVS